MKNFTYYNPTKVVFGKGEIARLKNLVPAGKKILLTYGGGSIKKNGVYDQVKAALKGRIIVEFGGIEPNPEYTTLMKAIEVVRNEKIEFLLAVGGGSVIDGTKFIAIGAPYKGDPWDFAGDQKAPEKTLPLGCVLTLPATGSESNKGAVISRKEINDKQPIHSPLTFPVFAVLDPTVTYSLPKKQLANGIADTFIHVIEQYLTFPVGALLQDRQAEAILKTLVEIAPAVLDSPHGGVDSPHGGVDSPHGGVDSPHGGGSYQVRATFMWCATQGLNGLIACGVPQDWATHLIGHQLTAFYGLDHAQSLVIVLPRLMDMQREQKMEKLFQYGQRVWGLHFEHEVEHEKQKMVSRIIQQTEDFFRSLGMKTKLSDYGIDVNDAVQKIGGRFKEWGFKMGERGDVDAAKVIEILKKC